MAVNALKQLSSSVMLKVENRFEDLKSVAEFSIAAPKKWPLPSSTPWDRRMLCLRSTAPFRGWGERSAPRTWAATERFAVKRAAGGLQTCVKYCSIRSNEGQVCVTVTYYSAVLLAMRVCWYEQCAFTSELVLIQAGGTQTGPVTNKDICGHFVLRLRVHNTCNCAHFIGML